jgi:hypothetical protein
LQAAPDRVASTYHVSPGGDDGADGSAARPWQTLQRAAQKVAAGDTVIVAAGQYAGFVLGWDSPQSGTPDAPIVFRAESGATITARNNKTPDGINLERCSHVTVEGFTIVPDAGQGVWRSGLRAGGGGTGVVLRGNTIKMRTTDRYGLYTSFTTDLLVEGNRISGSYNAAVYTANSPVRPTLRGNHVFDALGCGLHFNGDSSQGGSGVITGAMVEDNVVHDVGQKEGAAINMDGAQDSHIQNNLIYAAHRKGIALYRTDSARGAKNNVVVNNTVVVAADGQWALRINSASTDNTVYNNILCSENPSTGSISISADSLSGLTSDYNCVADRFSNNDFGRRISLARWRSSTGQDVHSVVATPADLFADAAANDYRLRPGSPAVDAGTATQAPRKDRAGRPRPAGKGYDIGAYEGGDATPEPGESGPGQEGEADAAPPAPTATARGGSEEATSPEWLWFVLGASGASVGLGLTYRLFRRRH